MYVYLYVHTYIYLEMRKATEISTFLSMTMASRYEKKSIHMHEINSPFGWDVEWFSNFNSMFVYYYLFIFILNAFRLPEIAGGDICA